MSTMSLTATYQTFLATANPQLLANNAALHYVNTLTTFKEPAVIVEHLATQQKQLKKKQEKVLGSVESSNAVCLDVEMIIEFVSSGGAYLPGLDDNFIADKVVVIPILHIVHFDGNGKITQMRQHWDQGALLKNIDVIGSRGQNWPIKDGNDQAKLIVTSIEAASNPAEGMTKSLGENSIAASQPARRLNPTNDPHTSLSLFDNSEASHKAPDPIMRGSMKPPSRDWEELFAGGYSADAPKNTNRSASPSKNTYNTTIMPKAGSNKNFAQSRIFDTDEVSDKLAGPGTGTPSRSASPSKEHYITTHPSKYKHFEFYDGHNEPAPPPSAPRAKTKHQSQFEFADFSTPAKQTQRTHAQSNPSFRIGAENEPEQKAVKKDPITKSHHDQDVHFELQDDGTAPADNRPRLPRGAVNTSGSAFFTNHTLADNEKFSPDTHPGKNTRGTSVKDRSKDFGAHYTIADDPTAAPPDGQGDDTRKNVTATSLKDRSKDFNAHYIIADSSPGLAQRSSAAMNRTTGYGHQAEDTPLGVSKGKENMGIHTAGDGMGTRKGAVKTFEENVGIVTAGDGMGGKKGRDKGWGFGDNDVAQGRPKAAPGRKLNTAAQSSLWDPL